MAKSINTYLPLRPGAEQAFYGATSRSRVSPDEGEFGYFSNNAISGVVETIGLGYLGGRTPYSTNIWTETKDGSGTIAAGAGGLVVTSTTTAAEDYVINGTRTNVLAANKIYCFSALLQASSFNATTGVLLSAGVKTSATAEILSANPADGVFFVSAAGGAVVGRVVENSGTAADTSTLFTASAATNYRVGFVFSCGSSAANSWGYWYTGAYASETAPTRTAFTADQCTALYNMVTTTAPTLNAHVGMRNIPSTGTTSRTVTADFVMAECDR